MKDKDIKYYPQVLLEECSYKVFSNNRLIHLRLKFSDIEPDETESESESEKEINEDTV